MTREPISGSNGDDHKGPNQSKLPEHRNQTIGRRIIDLIRFPAPYQGPILAGRIDGLAYLVGWIATLLHLALAACVVLLGIGRPWPTIASLSSAVGTLLFVTIVIVIHRRVGESNTLPRDVVWQWWLGPWDPVGRLVWLPVRIPEALRAIARGVHQGPPAPDDMSL